jgi:hypothetical protein
MWHVDRFGSRARLLDEETAERLLAGRVPADDAPPGFGKVVELVHVLAADPDERGRRGGREVVEGMAAQLRDVAPVPARAKARGTRRRIAQLAAVGTVGAVGLVSGLAAANALPGATQGIASDALGTLGVHVPSPSGHADVHPETGGQSPSQPAPNGMGDDVSSLATADATSGRDHGAAVSGLASDGRSQAGVNGSPSAPDAASPPGAPFSTPAATRPEVTPPVSTPPGSFPPVTSRPPITPPVTTPTQSHSTSH